MKYLSEILAFYDWMECNQLNPTDISLWHALMNVANKSGWQEWFTVPVITLELKTGSSRSGVYVSRNKLRQLGLIEFRDRGGSKCSEYRLCPLCGRNTDTTQTQVGTQSAHNTDTTQTQVGIINKTRVDKTRVKPYNPFFDEFWAAYPRKAGKGKAEEAYAKIAPDETLHAQMLDAVKRAAATEQWQRDGGQYIPYPATWLNQRRWEDEYAQAPEPKGKEWR